MTNNPKKIITNASDLLIPHMRNSTVGFVNINHPPPKVLGSGVLISVGDISGILTCAHVAKAYEKCTKLGLVRFVRDALPQQQELKMEGTRTIWLYQDSIGDDPYAVDLAFMRLSEIDAGSLKAFCTFLNVESNSEKLQQEPEHQAGVHAVFGLVDELSGEPRRSAGFVTTPMHGALVPGTIVHRENGTVTLERMKPDADKPPKKFGGMSGGGLWLTLLNIDGNGSYIEIETRLCGVASFQKEGNIVCQGIERIQLLLEKIKNDMS